MFWTLLHLTFAIYTMRMTEETIFDKWQKHTFEFYPYLVSYLYGTLNTLEASLPEHSFVRIHQSYLVNLKHIRDVARYKVILENEDELAVPKVRYPYVREKYITYQGEVL